jgi:hypothetical protein
MIRLVAAALAAFPLVAFAQDATTAAAPARPPLRDGVYAGVGLGASGLFSPNQALLAYRIRFGMARSPRVQLGLELQRAEGDASELAFTDLAATFFPFDRTFFARAGFGFSSIQRTRTTVQAGGFPLPVVEGGSGVNVLAGLGAQLGRTNGLNVTVNVDGQVHRLKSLLSDQHTEEATISGWLGVEWH